MHKVMLTILSIAFAIAAQGFDVHLTLDGKASLLQRDTVLPGTRLLEWDLAPNVVSRTMLEGAHQHVEELMRTAMVNRSRVWKRNFTSQAAYEQSVDPNRKRFMQAIGVVDKSNGLVNYSVGIPDQYPSVSMQIISLSGDPAIVAETDAYTIYQVRWPVLNQVYGEGLLLQPKKAIVGNIVAIPDADQTPEQLVGLSPGVPAHSQFARHLAENGYKVLVPVVISRDLLFEGQLQEQTHREWIYRQAFHMGRHLIGYEVQKVIAAIDWFKQSGDKNLKTGIAGYCEGGLLAMYTAAVDKRVDAVLVSGYFTSREKVWDEPIYRNVWGQVAEFGDAEIATLISPRSIVVEYSAVDPGLEARTSKPAQVDKYKYSGYKGSLKTPSYQDVKLEFDRLAKLLKGGQQQRSLITGHQNMPTEFGSAAALEKFSAFMGNKSLTPLSSTQPVDKRSRFDSKERQLSQVKELEDHVQWLMRDSDYERNRFFLHNVLPEFRDKQWSTRRYHAYFSPDKFVAETEKYRAIFHEEILGKLDAPMLPPNARTRKIYDEPLWTGFEVVLDVYKDFIAPGILLLPKDIKPGERRPVVVCQHGRNGVPQVLVEGNTSYYDMAAKLADQGFIVYAPYGLFSGEDRYRWLARKANTIRKTLFSFVIAQHDQTLQWLGTLPFVDPERIAFYGKSYGGETAMRVPSVLQGYCLSICSADFGDWTRKVIDTHYSNSFMNTIEWEMPYFNMGSTFSYAEMAYLIFPRPFMVERGRHDLVQPDPWVAYEYEKVSHFYDQFNLGDKTAIEFFNGGHASRNEGTFEFLHKHLRWP